jgi:histidine ammonia-lyase
LSRSGRAVFELVRQGVAFIENDVYMSPEMEKCAALVRSGEVVRVAEKVSGKLK